jgi:hypothetical protein
MARMMPGIQVFRAADEIEYFAADRIEHHAVDGEVAAGDIFAGILAEADFIGMASVGVAEIAAEGRHFDGFGLRLGALTLGFALDSGSGTSTTPNCAPTA